MKRDFWFEIVKLAIIALIIVIPIRYLIFQAFLVKGQSMEPNFSQYDYLIVDELTYQFRPPERGEVIIFKSPVNPSQRYIKRIIGLPKENIEIKDNKIVITPAPELKQPAFTLDESEYLSNAATTIGNKQWQLTENEYFVLGDNRMFSSDSRSWDPLPKQNIIGRALLRLWPFTEITKLTAPAY